MEKPTYLITHTPMKFGYTQNEWQGDTQADAIKGFLAWVDRRGEFVDIESVRLLPSYSDRFAAAHPDGVDTRGD